ncbi:hypothetical protein P6U16_04210 [Rhizobium sp. 32-5/1]|uniref:hypothetical protein n=1 Tax=Rhizobium sp. 32-5/1 TaxID=3019602 RepID=UPI00240E4D65|nr:hypothetical protein [Rhizobium sp. 32-5/1]WEZ83953.1 hypothetical protein P6U16_04210 [Rhizobium sp. 32-5/1]
MARIRDLMTSLSAEIFGNRQANPVAGEKQPEAFVQPRREGSAGGAGGGAGITARDTDGCENPKPTQPDPQQVQYPGYFKDGGSL